MKKNENDIISLKNKIFLLEYELELKNFLIKTNTLMYEILIDELNKKKQEIKKLKLKNKKIVRF